MKKGFTLIELLGVIVILGIIGLIVVPVVQGTIKNSTINLCKDQIKIFEKAAKNYVAAHPYYIDSYEENTDREKTISLDDLKSEGYLEQSQLENPRGGSFNGGVKITYDGVKYTYQYESGAEEANCED